MLLGRDTPGKEQRVEAARAYFADRSIYAVVAGLLGLLSPVDGIILPLFSIAAIATGIVGLAHIRRRPELLGTRLCILGLVGGVVGLGLFVVFQVVRF